MSGILVIADRLEDTVSSISNETVGAAVALAERSRGPVNVALIGNRSDSAVGQLHLQGVDTLYTIDPGTWHFDAAAYEQAVFDLGRALRPSLILTGHTIDAMTFAPAFAVRTGCGFASDVFEIEVSDDGVIAKRGAYGNKVNSTLSFRNKSVVMLTIRAGTFAPNAPGDPAKKVVFNVREGGKPPASSHVEYVPPAEAGVDIDKSDFILAVGRGIQDEANIPRFQELANKLGATLGCSRPIVDSGWLPKAHQVGQSGKVAANCKVYLALGISGAVQHLHGMKHVETVIAVNTDPNAQIFNAARYGANLDVMTFADALDQCFPERQSIEGESSEPA